MFASREYPINPSESLSWCQICKVYLKNFGIARNVLSDKYDNNARYSLSFSGATKDFHGDAGTATHLLIPTLPGGALARKIAGAVTRDKPLHQSFARELVPRSAGLPILLGNITDRRSFVPRLQSYRPSG
jgi:hypothetical protein